MEEKIAAIKEWLGTGSINVFGLPMSGKDTVGVKLAETLGARFLSSGMIIRAMEQENKQHLTASGVLVPTNLFYDWVLPYFDRPDLKESALVLSSVGRWSGEEDEVIAKAAESGHETKAVIVLNISEADVWNRWEAVREQGMRDGHEVTRREDDKSRSVFQVRIDEFIQKTMPVIEHYREMGILVPVQADMSREEVLGAVINHLYDFVTKGQNY